jgi:hypothetical protein
MSKVLRDAGSGRELILTNDKVNPFVCGSTAPSSRNHGRAT